MEGKPSKPKQNLFDRIFKPSTGPADLMPSLTEAILRGEIKMPTVDPFAREYSGRFLTLDEERASRGLPSLGEERASRGLPSFGSSGTLRYLEEELCRSVQVHWDAHGNYALDLRAFRGNSLPMGVGLDIETVRRYADKAWSRLTHSIDGEWGSAPPVAALAQEACREACREISRALDGGDPEAMRRAAMEFENQRRFPTDGPFYCETEPKPKEPKTAFLEGLEEIE